MNEVYKATTKKIHNIFEKYRNRVLKLRLPQTKEAATTRTPVHLQVPQPSSTTIIATDMCM